jgi:ubiquinone/menaquinone biosynthesis C-methylase UbiE
MHQSSDQLYTSGTYLKNNPGWHQEGSKWKADLVYDFIKRFNIPAAQVTEVGCGAGEILVQLAKQLGPAAVLKGYDISPQAIRIAKEKETEQLRFFPGDYTKIYSSKVDLILVIDVIEHVEDIYSFLRALKPAGRNFIFHIPLDLCCRTILKPHVMLQQRTSVGHIHYFTEETALWLLRDTGYVIEHFIYTKPEIDLVKPQTVKQWIKKVLRRSSYAVNKKLSVKLWGGYSLLLYCKPMNESNE